jgi:transcriptional regulator with XRE-family HTH domain
VPLVADTKLARLRAAFPLTQEQLAARAGVPLRTMLRIERGELGVRGPNLNQLVRLAHALRVSVGELIEDEWLDVAGTPVPLVAPRALPATNAPERAAGCGSRQPDALDVLVQWLREGGLDEVDEAGDPQAVISARARTLGLSVRAQSLAIRPDGETRGGWVVFPGAGSRSELVAVLVRGRDGVRPLRF